MKVQRIKRLIESLNESEIRQLSKVLNEDPLVDEFSVDRIERKNKEKDMLVREAVSDKFKEELNKEPFEVVLDPKNLWGGIASKDNFHFQAITQQEEKVNYHIQFDKDEVRLFIGDQQKLSKEFQQKLKLIGIGRFETILRGAYKVYPYTEDVVDRIISDLRKLYN